jgi:hypothetical protein
MICGTRAQEVSVTQLIKLEPAAAKEWVMKALQQPKDKKAS